ncbi:MAG: hydroxymethylglutaryl-CoA lyase [Rhodospirillaceae bacterium]|nr:hydroxymethylglutaryl-CoA lyase [Rhodospirillaceae bacterium]
MNTSTPAKKSVTLVEVGPRDGLQSEPKIMPTEDKVEFIKRAIDAGVRRIEVASFVNPKRVPQMADAEAVLAQVPRNGRASYIGLILNMKGFERARDAKVDEVGYAVVATDTFATKNQGMTSAETVKAWQEVGALAKSQGFKTSVTIGASFGCPFEGEVPAARVVDIAKRCAEVSPDEIALADTIGCGDPVHVSDLIKRVKDALPSTPIRVHLHNTRNTGLANAYAAVMAGADFLDASTGGIGGCPFAPRATGNIPMEDLIYMLNRMGVSTGVDIDKVIATAQWVEDRLGKPIPAMLGKAGVFPNVARAA